MIGYHRRDISKAVNDLLDTDQVRLYVQSPNGNAEKYASTTADSTLGMLLQNICLLIVNLQFRKKKKKVFRGYCERAGF